MIVVSFFVLDWQMEIVEIKKTRKKTVASFPLPVPSKPNLETGDWQPVTSFTFVKNKFSFEVMASEHSQTSLFSADKKLTFITLCLFSVLLLFVKKSSIEYETIAIEILQYHPEGM